MLGMAKTTSDSILGVIRKESWITLKFSLPLLSMGHKGNRCETEDGAATWRTTWPWRRCAGFDCFLVLYCCGFQDDVCSCNYTVAVVGRFLRCLWTGTKSWWVLVFTLLILLRALSY